MRKIAGALAFLLAVALGAPLSASESSRREPRVSRVAGLVRVELDPADRFTLTPEFIAAAEPVVFEPESTSRALQPAPKSSEQDIPVIVPGSAPAGPSAEEAAAARAAHRLAKATAGLVPYDRFQVPDPSAAPFRTHGKLYMLLADGQSQAVCSATVVDSPSGMVIMTAGHCVQDPVTGEFIIAANFVPGYLGQDVSPFGFWPLASAIVTQEWFDSSLAGNPDARFDLAVATVDSVTPGGKLQDTVGSRGLAFNLPQGQTFQSFGYPAEAPFGGELMISCDSDPAVIDPQYDGPPFPNAMGCDMTGGSSGGGWVINGSLVNSVVSYGKTVFPEMQFGPYFGPVALSLYEFVAETDFPEPPEPELESFGTNITMKLKKHLKASGKVTSSSPACAANAPVLIGKVKGNVANAVAQTLSKPSGKYSVKVPDKKGKYVAFALESYRDSFTLCGESQSKVLKHKH